MKKFLSALFSIAMIAAIVVGVFYHQQFMLHQLDKIKGMYYVYKGDKAYKVMDTKKAITNYNTGLNFYPKHFGAWYNLGNIYVAYEDYSSALYAYAQAFKYNPKMMIARINYGIVSSEMLGDFDSAIKQYDEVIRTKRKLIDIPYIYNNKVSYKKNKAIAYYNKGVTYRLKALYTTEDWEIQRKYMAQAIRAYERSIKIDENSYDAQYNLGIAYHTTGDYQRAGKCYCKAISIAPMNYEAHYNLAILLRKMGKYDDAYDEIEKTTTLITALNENSAIQQYVSIVLNDITRSVYGNGEYRTKLENAIAAEESLIKNNSTKYKNNKKKKEKSNKSIISKGIFSHREKAETDDNTDKIIYSNFGTCPSMSYFTLYENEDM